MFVKETKQKIKKIWLDYYEQNEEMVELLSSEKYGFLIDNDSQSTSYRPQSSFIIGILCSQDQEISDLIQFSLSVNIDLDEMILALGLNHPVKVLYEERQKDNNQISYLKKSSISLLDYIHQKNANSPVR